MHTTVADKQAYSAEDAVFTMSRATGPVAAYGSLWDIERLPTYSLVKSVATVCDRVCARHALSPVTVRVNSRLTADRLNAFYRDDVIHLAERGRPWSANTVLHEIAHHAAPAERDHGPRFRQALVTLLAAEGYPVFATLLGIQYDQFGLGYCPPTTTLV